MSQYMLLVDQEEVDPAEQAEREKEMPLFVELHRSLREAGLLVGVQRTRVRRERWPTGPVAPGLEGPHPPARDPGPQVGQAPENCPGLRRR
jgi:hypothetical protein